MLISHKKKFPITYLLAFLFFLIGCQEKANTNSSTPKTNSKKTYEVRVTTVMPMTWKVVVNVYGRVESGGNLQIINDVLGKVKKNHFDVGEKVKKDQILITFDNSDRKIFFEQARSKAKASQASLEAAKSNFDRTQNLHIKGHVPRSQLDTAKEAVEVASSNYKNALSSMRLASKDLKETSLRSPVTGVVEKRLVEPGEQAMAGKLLAVIQILDTLKIATYVTEREVNYIKVGDLASVKSPGVRNKVYTAKVESIGISSHPDTGNFPVILRLKNEDNLLRPGMATTVELGGAEVAETIAIPYSALVDRDLRKVVYIEKDGKAFEIKPVLGVSQQDVFQGDMVIVLEGLKEGDHLIVKGANTLMNGTEVIVKEGSAQ